jgi:hypothetical protein
MLTESEDKPYHTVSDGRDLEGSCHGLKGAKKTVKTLSQDSQCPSQDLNQTPSEYQSRALTLTSTCSVSRASVSKSSIKLVSSVNRFSLPISQLI